MRSINRVPRRFVELFVREGELQKKEKAGQQWLIDVTYDLSDGKRQGILTIIETYSKKRANIELGSSPERLIEALSSFEGSRGLPKSIDIDNRCEFTDKALDSWALDSSVKIPSSQNMED